MYRCFCSIFFTCCVAASPVSAQQFDPTRPLSPDQIAFTEHLSKNYGAYFLRLNENIEPGDTLSLPRYNRSAPRSICFPDLPEPNKVDQGKYELGTRIDDLSGALKIEAGVDTEIELKFVQKTDNGLEKVQASFLPYKAKDKYDGQACPWVKLFYKGGKHDGKNIIIKAALYAKGKFSVSYEFGVKGKLSVNITKKIKSYLKQWGLSRIFPDTEIDAAIQGEFKTSHPATSEWNKVTSVGFIPEAINKKNLDHFIQHFLYKKQYQNLKKIIKNPEDAAKYLNENPKYAMIDNNTPFLLREGAAIKFNRDLPEHKFAIYMDNLIVIANYRADQLRQEK